MKRSPAVRGRKQQKREVSRSRGPAGAGDGDTQGAPGPARALWSASVSCCPSGSPRNLLVPGASVCPCSAEVLGSDRTDRAEVTCSVLDPEKKGCIWAPLVSAVRNSRGVDSRYARISAGCIVVLFYSLVNGFKDTDFPPPPLLSSS